MSAIDDGSRDTCAVLEARIVELEKKLTKATAALQVEEGLRHLAEIKAREWHHLASIDPLTEMFNRRQGMEAFRKMAEKRQKRKDGGLQDDSSKRFTVLFIDLDKFGQINKMHGDQTGDDALQVVAKTILNSIRESDRPYAFRKGGDEFIIGLEDASLEDANNIVIERLVEALNGKIQIIGLNGQIINIRGSIGVYEWNDALDIKGNFAKADEKMRVIKQERHTKQRMAACDFDHRPVDPYQINYSQFSGYTTPPLNKGLFIV